MGNLGMELMEDRWKVTNDDEAEWIIEKVNEELVEKARFKMSLENKIKVLQDKLRKLEDEERAAIEKRDSYLLEYFETIDEKFKKKTKTQEKYRLPSGEIVKKYPGPEFKRDNDKLLNWTKKNAPEYVEIKETPKWGELKKITKVVNGQVITEDGEIVEGVEVIERPPVMEFKEV
ncbi:MAG: host-nuclease inhibitor Gam family protein [Tissierellaceae bacterium]|nr:host-nuclease inhibitor Gam family protein [Tissierellaceae bacterium]